MFDSRESSDLFNKMLKQADFLNEFKYITNAILYNTGYYSKNIEEKISKYEKMGVKKEIIDSMITIQKFLKIKADLLLLDTNDFIKTQTMNISEIDEQENEIDIKI